MPEGIFPKNENSAKTGFMIYNDKFVTANNLS